MSVTEEQKFKDEFKAREYLKTYYSSVDLMTIHRFVLERSAAQETARIMIHMETVARPLIRALFGSGKASVLELGGGPTVYQLFAVAPEVKKIHFTDYSEDNLNEINKWLNKKTGAYDWSMFAKAAMMLKKDSIHIKESEIMRLENLLRTKISKVSTCDIFARGLGVGGNYDVINSHFVAESATTSKKKWSSAIKNIHDKLNKGGVLFMSALKGAGGSYNVLGKQFPAVSIKDEDLEKELKKVGFREIEIASLNTEDKSNNYKGFIFAVAQKG